MNTVSSKFSDAISYAVDTHTTEAIERKGNRAGWITLLQQRNVPCFGMLEATSLLIYMLLLACFVPRHEAWFDEAQAWLIARSTSLAVMVTHSLHYEGSPALWHLLLWIESRLGVSFLGMHLIAGVLAACGVLVWLRYSPLPRIVTLLAPFTYYILYQYAVVARSYVLAPLFVFGLLALYSKKRSSPYAFALLAGLLANSSLHMAAMSLGLSILYAIDRLKDKEESQSRWRLLIPALLLGICFGLSAATAVPTLDGSSTRANPLVEALRRNLPSKIKNTAPVPTFGVDEVSDEQVSSTAPLQGPLATRVWAVIHRASGAGAGVRVEGQTLKHLLVLLTAVTAPVSTSNVIAAVLIFLIAANLWRARLLLALLPYVLVQMCNVLISGEAHHIGLVWIALMSALWLLALEQPLPGFDGTLRRAMYAWLLIVLMLQIGWSAHALGKDWTTPYSSSKATAAFLESLPEETRVAAFDDDSVTVNAYMPHRPYFNQKLDYWPFSRTTNPNLFLEQTMATQPTMVILKMSTPVSPVMDQWVKLSPAGTVFVDSRLIQRLTAEGYRETHRFCGSRFYRNTSESVDCRLVFERSSRP